MIVIIKLVVFSICVAGVAVAVNYLRTETDTDA